MAETAELDVAPDTIEATLNYIADDGKPVYTIVAAPRRQRHPLRRHARSASRDNP